MSKAAQALRVVQVLKPFYPTSLAFEGGVVRGMAYPGAIKVMEEQGRMRDVRRVVGSSSGGIMATLVALGAPADLMKTYAIEQIDLKQVFGGNWGLFGQIERAVVHGGVSYGEYLRATMADMIEQLTGDGELTFGQLGKLIKAGSISRAGLPFLELYLPTTNLSRNCLEVFSHETAKDLCIADAVRMGSSFPVMFTPVRYNGCYYGDAGIIRNYPVAQFDYLKYACPDTERAKLQPYKRIYNEHTLGFCFANSKETEAYKNNTLPPIVNEIDGDISLAKAFAYCALSADAFDLFAESERSVFIDASAVGVLDTAMTREDKEGLMATAARATEDFLYAKDRGANEHNIGDERKEQGGEVNLGGVRSSLVSTGGTFVERENRRRVAAKAKEDSVCVIL
jgi:NTE family protein